MIYKVSYVVVGEPNKGGIRNQIERPEIGSRVRFRCVCRKAWRFKSSLAHQDEKLDTWSSFLFWSEDLKRLSDIL